jgi:hypothetical protein
MRGQRARSAPPVRRTLRARSDGRPRGRPDAKAPRRERRCTHAPSVSDSSCWRATEPVTESPAPLRPALLILRSLGAARRLPTEHPDGSASSSGAPASPAMATYYLSVVDRHEGEYGSLLRTGNKRPSDARHLGQAAGAALVAQAATYVDSSTPSDQRLSAQRAACCPPTITAGARWGRLGRIRRQARICRRYLASRTRASGGSPRFGG